MRPDSKLPNDYGVHGGFFRPELVLKSITAFSIGRTIPAIAHWSRKHYGRFGAGRPLLEA
jgi:hypothetical protein